MTGFSGVAVGVDVGGTFTDIVVAAGGRIRATAKVPSTPSRPWEAVVTGVVELLGPIAGAGRSDVRVAHGTTIATNALLERTGARVGLLTTDGFEDVLEIGRLARSDIYDLNVEAETPTFLAPRYLRRGVGERIGSDGIVLRPLDQAAVRAAAEQLVATERVEAIAICFLFSYLNPAHERLARELVLDAFPDVAVSISSDVDGRFREYERTATTAFDAYLHPVVSTYLTRLGGELAREGIESPPWVMQSAGGLTSLGKAARRPVALLRSGLAAGVNGASEFAQRAGLADVITLDMGGTSCDVAVIHQGSPLTRPETRVGTYPIRVASVDVTAIGAGGGTIAWIDDADGLHVGPRSAAAEPGPACYARGGRLPTLTDASLVLGYLNPRFFAGGAIELDTDLAVESISPLADRLRRSVPEVALGMHSIANSAMANAIRGITQRRGLDARRHALVPFGGAGPVHGPEVARLLGMSGVVVPPAPGLLSALGLLVSPVTHEERETVHAPLSGLPGDELDARFGAMVSRGRTALAELVGEFTAQTVGFAAQLRYRGQAYELQVTGAPTEGSDWKTYLAQAFHERHERVYGRRLTSKEIELVEVSTIHAAHPRKPESSGGDAGSGARLTRTRDVFLGDTGRFETVPVFARSELPIGTKQVGPLIVEQADTTLVVGRHQTLEVASSGHIEITLPEGGR